MTVGKGYDAEFRAKERKFNAFQKRRVNKKYAKQINKFIPLALVLADEEILKLKKQGNFNPSPKVTGKMGIEFKWSVHTEIFHREMNRLAKEAGLRN